MRQAGKQWCSWETVCETEADIVGNVHFSECHWDMCDDILQISLRINNPGQRECDESRIINDPKLSLTTRI